MTDTPTTNPLQPVIWAVGRHFITAAAVGLAAHGYIDQKTADSAVDPLTDYVLAAVFAGASAGYAGFKAWLMHTRWYQAYISPAQPIPAKEP